MINHRTLPDRDLVRRVVWLRLREAARGLDAGESKG
jgi:hypothetical protein